MPLISIEGWGVLHQRRHVCRHMRLTWEFAVGRMLKDPDAGGGADGDDEMDDAAEGAGVLVAEKTIEQQILDAIVDAGALLEL